LAAFIALLAAFIALVTVATNPTRSFPRPTVRKKRASAFGLRLAIKKNRLSNCAPGP
jgi:hypothetical protein